MEIIKKWSQGHSWVLVLLTALTLFGGLFVHMSTTYATIREVDRTEAQVNIIDETLRKITKEISNTKTMVVMLNANMTDRLQSMQSRLDRIDNRLSRIEGNMMDSTQKK